MNNYCYRKIRALLRKFSIPEVIQICILLAIVCQGYFLYNQTKILEENFNVDQRPVVVVSDIEPTVLANESLQSKIAAEDEYIIKVMFKNLGKSEAYVDYIRVKIFCGYFKRNAEKLCFIIHDMASDRQRQRVDKEVRADNVEIFKDSVLPPNQTVPFSTMVDAKQLMDNIRSYTSSREAPIFIECEVRYSSDRGKKYWYNCIYELQWPLAKHITIFSKLIKSNAKDEPLHLTSDQLFMIVAERQKVLPVIDALKNEGRNLEKIMNCDGIRP